MLRCLICLGYRVYFGSIRLRLVLVLNTTRTFMYILSIGCLLVSWCLTTCRFRTVYSLCTYVLNVLIFGIINLLVVVVSLGLVSIAILVLVVLRVCRVECRPFDLQLRIMIDATSLRRFRLRGRWRVGGWVL